VVSVGTYSAWDNTATLRLLGGARNACAPTERRGRDISWRQPAYKLFLDVLLLVLYIFFIIYIYIYIYILLVSRAIKLDGVWGICMNTIDMLFLFNDLIAF